MHLGQHETPEAALATWPNEVKHLRRIGRDDRANKLEGKLNKLRALLEKRNGEE